MKIFLLGLPGSGKTTLGKRLSAALTIPFVDLDQEIERREGSPIPVIFKEKKEPHFRQVESEELNRWCASPDDFVMSTGGGAPCFFNNMDVITRSGTSIFLDVPPSEIARRIALTKVEERPLIAASGKDGLKDHIEFMRSNRIAYYQRATFTFAGTDIMLNDLLTAIRGELPKGTLRT